MARGEERVLLSVVVPAFNEEEVIADTLRDLSGVLGLCATDSYEIIVVDDGSRDRTAELVRQSMDWEPRVRLLRLQRNSGHMDALSVGYEHARGTYVVTIDADRQDPPSLIAEMLETAQAGGLDVVYGVRSDRSSDTWFKRSTAGLYYWLMKRTTGIDLIPGAADFRLVSRSVVNALNELPKDERVYRLLVPWLGFPSGQVNYVRVARAAGQSHYTIGRMLGLTLDSILMFSTAPLRAITYLGVLGVVFAGLMTTIAVVAFMNGVVVPGWTSVILTVVFMGALNLLCVGLLAEWTARIRKVLQRRESVVLEIVPGADPRPVGRSGTG